MKKLEITNHQMWALVALYTCGTTILVVSAALASFSKQDAWIAVIVTAIIGLFFIWMYVHLGSLYPDKSFIEIIWYVFGKWMGSAIVIMFLFFCLVNVSQVVSYINGFMTTQFLPRTSTNAVAILLVSVIIIALLYGIEAIARSAEIFIYFISFTFLLSMVLVAPNAQIDNLLPILEKGVVPVFKGVFQLSSFITWPVVLVMMIYPLNSSNTKKAGKSIFTGYLWACFLIFISNTMSIMVLGTTIASSTIYPTYLLAKEIHIGTILTRVEGVIASVWIITVFYRAVMYFYGFVIGLSKLIGIKDYRRIVIPFGLIIIILSNVVYPNYAYEAKYDGTTWVLYSLTFGGVLPVALLVGGFIKKKLENN